MKENKEEGMELIHQLTKSKIGKLKQYERNSKEWTGIYLEEKGIKFKE